MSKQTKLKVITIYFCNTLHKIVNNIYQNIVIVIEDT